MDPAPLVMLWKTRAFGTRQLLQNKKSGKEIEDEESRK
jgi:hypothetical protein